MQRTRLERRPKKSLDASGWKRLSPHPLSGELLGSAVAAQLKRWKSLLIKMKRFGFRVGLVLNLAGLTMVIVGGILKPPIALPWNQWKSAAAPTHLLWMGGLAMCTAGVILIVRDTFRN
jgi:hypothetical protein